MKCAWCRTPLMGSVKPYDGKMICDSCWWTHRKHALDKENARAADHDH